MTIVRRGPAESEDPDMLLVSLLAGRLPSRLASSSLARSPKVLLRLEASLEGGSWPARPKVLAKVDLAEKRPGEGRR